MKKILYILTIIGSFFIGWGSSYIYHEDLYANCLSSIELFHNDLEKDRWIIEQYSKERRRIYEDSTENKMADYLGKFQVHIKYKQKVNGYGVSAVCLIDKEHNGVGYSRINQNAIWGNSWLYFKNDRHELIIRNPSFTDEILFNNDKPLMDMMSIEVDYTPFEQVSDNTFSGNKSPFFFFDIDFDGEEELIVCQWEQMGYRGHHTYKAYKTNVAEGSCMLPSMQGEPFDELNDYTIFDTPNKTINIPIEVGLKMGGYKIYGQKILYELKEIEEYDWEHTRDLKYEFCEPTVYHYKMINGDKRLVKINRCSNDTIQ